MEFDPNRTYLGKQQSFVFDREATLRIAKTVVAMYAAKSRKSWFFLLSDNEEKIPEMLYRDDLLHFATPANALF